MPTVGTLAYQIVANTSNFTQGLTGSRKELKTLKDAFLTSITPAEKYGAAIAHLESLAVKFPEKADIIRRSIAQMRAEMQPASQTSKVLGDVLGRMGIVLDPVSAAFQALNVATGIARAGLHAVQDIAEKVSDSMERLDETAKKARLLGVSPEMLVGLRRAAEDLSGVAADAFDSAFQKFTRNIAQAAMTGKGQGAEALSRLGLSAKELSGMSPDAALLRVADSLEKVQDPSERLQLAFQLLGKEGANLATMLAAGDEEIKKLIADQLELSQTEFIDFKSIEEANDEMGRFSTLMQSIFDLLASELAPLIKDVTGDLTEGFSGASNKGEGLRNTIQMIAFTAAALVDEIEGIGGAMKTVNNAPPKWLRAWLPGFQQVDMAMGAAGLLFQPSGAPGTRLGNLQQNTLDKINGLNKDKAATVDEIAKKEDEKEKAKEAARGKRLEDQKERAAKAAAAKEKARQKQILDGLAEGQRQAEAAKRRIEDEAIEKANRLFESNMTPTEKIREELAELDRLRSMGALDDRTYNRELTRLKGQARDIANIDKAVPQSISAIRAGSVEALRASMGQTMDEKQLEEQKKQTEEAKEGNKLLGEINARLAVPALKEAV